MGSLNDETFAKYETASAQVGLRFISAALKDSTLPPGEARSNFDQDHEMFMRDIGRAVRPRTIGGGSVDNFKLIQECLERGGVQQVINKRAFKNIARALNIPKSCTSAATVLRQYYGDQLYRYEQKFVFNRDASSHELVPLSAYNKHGSNDSMVPGQGLGPGAAAANIPAAAARNQAAVTARDQATAAVRNQAAAVARNKVAAAARSQAAAGTTKTAVATPPAKLALQDRLERAASTEGKTQQQVHQQPAQSQRQRQALQLQKQKEHKHKISRRRRVGAGTDFNSLTGRQQAIVKEMVGQARGVSTPFNVQASADRERLVAALKCPQNSEVSWALGVLNVHSYDARNTFQARLYPGLLQALQGLLALHLDDVLRRRVFGVTADLEICDPFAPRYASMAAAVVREAGDPMSGGAAGTGLGLCGSEDAGRAPTLQRNSSIFNCKDSMSVDREQWATVTVNVLRNMSYSDRNAMLIASSRSLLQMTAEMLVTFQVASTSRMGIMDMWINIAPYLNASKESGGEIILDTCIRLLDPFLTGADYSRFANAGEVLARLAASPERNEAAIVNRFDELLPRLIDMLGGRDRRYVNAGLAALCNCSSFDWSARGRIARTPRAVPRLISMLSDVELAPRASLTLLNLAETPSNRSVMLVHEKQLVSHAMQISPASETIASVLFNLSSA